MAPSITKHSIGSWKRDNMPGDPAEKERRYNFHRRVTDEHPGRVTMVTGLGARRVVVGAPSVAVRSKVSPPAWPKPMA